MARKGMIAASAVLLAGLGLTYVAWRSIESAEAEASASKTQRLAERTFSDALQRIRQPAYGLGGLRGALATIERPTPGLVELARYTNARDLPGEFPGVLGFGVITPVQRSAIAEFEASVRAEGDPSFRIQTSGSSDLLYVIKSIEPRDRNAKAIGFDVGSEPRRRAAVERVISEGRPIATAPIELRQDTGGRAGSLLMVPVFSSGRASRTTPDDAVVAVVYAALVYEDVIAGASAGKPSDARLIIRDVGDEQSVVVYDSAGARAPASSDAAIVQEVEMFGRPLQLVLEPAPSSAAATPARVVAMIGVLASLLFALLVFQEGRLRRVAEQLAAAMTKDLRRLASVARLTQNAVVITDGQGRIEWSNPAFQTLTGFSNTELIGHKPGALLQTEATDKSEVARLRHHLERLETFRGELLNRSKHGRDYLVELEIQPMFDELGAISGFISVETDVTEARAQSERLKASETLLDRTSELSRVGGWRVDLRSGVVHWSRMTRAIHEVDDAFVPSVQTGIEFYAPEARPVITAAVERGIADGRGWDLELPLITAKGRRIWVRAVGKPEYEGDALVALNGAFADVTMAVEARHHVEVERQRLELILSGTGAGTWEWNVQTGEVRFNERWAEIIGHTLDELAPVSIQTWMAHAHPDDLEESGRRLEAHFAGQTNRYEFEARMRHRDGRWVWVLDRGKVMTWTDDGKPEWMFGTHVDITQRKEAELSLRENEALLSTTLHSIGDAVLTTDADGRVTWINPVAELLTGWTAVDAKGQQASEVLRLEIEGQPGWAPCPIATCLAEKRKVGLAGSTVLIARDGRRFFIEDSAAPLRGPHGEVLGAVMVFHDVTEKAELAREMSFRATHDALTGLINRLEFEAAAQRTLDAVKKGARPGVLMFLDLDHFKMVNDACGHTAGDRLLVQVAAMFRKEVRGRDVVARFGGDEFAIILDQCPVEQGQRIAQKIVDGVDDYRFVADDGRRFRVGVSIGLVPIDDRWINLPQLLQGADSACYTAKAEGRSRVVVDEGMHHIVKASRDIQWGPLIEQALDDDLFELYAQRVVPLKAEITPRLRCEVLLRMRSPEGQLHGPGSFIPAAERYQLASRIDRWVLRAALQALQGCRLDNIARVSINLSGQSVGDRNFHCFALKTIEASGIPADRLCIEITETAAVANLADAASFITALRAAGVVIALDDFGAGSSSFGYLKTLKVDKLKIDGQFVRGLLHGELESAAIRSFIDVARVLDLRSVAEQVESEAVATRLAQLGVDFGQGFFFHRPEPFADLLSTWESGVYSQYRDNVITPKFGHRGE